MRKDSMLQESAEVLLWLIFRHVAHGDHPLVTANLGQLFIPLRQFLLLTILVRGMLLVCDHVITGQKNLQIVSGQRWLYGSPFPFLR